MTVSRFRPLVPVVQRKRARFLSVTEAARLMHVSRMTVYRLCERGDLTNYRVGQSIIRIPEAAVDEYLESVRVGKPVRR